jgi:hypothetical protein
MVARVTSTLGFDVRLYSASSSIRRSVVETRVGYNVANGYNKCENVLSTDSQLITVDVSKLLYIQAKQPFTITVTRGPKLQEYVYLTRPDGTFLTRLDGTYFIRLIEPIVTDVEVTSYTETHSSLCLITPSAGEGETITVVVSRASNVDTPIVVVSA